MVLADDGHEIGVAAPAWDDVNMQVFLNAGAGGAAKVDADVEAVGFHDGGERVLAAADAVS